LYFLITKQFIGNLLIEVLVPLLATISLYFSSRFILRKLPNNKKLVPIISGIFLIFILGFYWINSGTLPELITNSISLITQTEAICGGKITSDGRSSIVGKGVCWSTKQNPTVLDNEVNNYTDGNNFETGIKGLSRSTTYYVRAYAKNKIGTGYGENVKFTTSSFGIPVISTTKIESVTSSSVMVNGIINSDGGYPINKKGFCWSTNQDPSIDDLKTIIRGKDDSYKATITGLKQNTSYYVRSFATNKYGTGYGVVILFTTLEKKFIGQSFGGGIIFYISSNGQHGLICAPYDQGRDKKWGREYSIVGVSDLSNVNSDDIKNKGSQDTAIGTGNRNTINIVKYWPDNNIAARICYNLSLNGYDDWYLPSQDELNLMYINLKLKGLGNFGPTVYWSSSEANLNNAWAQGFVSGTMSLNGKAFTASVRAIRSF
jgi:hypothetical protein